MADFPNAVPVRLPNGGTLYVASAVPIESDKESDVTGTPEQDFKEIKKTIEGVATAVREALDTVQPKKGSVEFGFEMKAKTNGVVALFASADVSANIKVKLEWESERGAK